MSIIAIIILALGLSMDSFAVSLTSGVALSQFKISNVLRIAFYLALFQAVMPLIGWVLGVGFIEYISSIDHWVAFALLVMLGGKMIYETLFKKDEEEDKYFNPTKTFTLIQMGIATSIDALAVGISFAFLDINLHKATAIIFAVTFLMSILGCNIGKYFGTRWNKPSMIAGGIILISIGTKILLEHIFLI